MSRKRRRGGGGGGGRAIVLRRPAPIVRRRRPGGLLGGLAWGVDLTDAVLAGVAATVGEAIRTAIRRYPKAPAILSDMPVDALGLYVLGLAFRRQALRSVGLGRGLAVTVLKIGEAVGG